MRLRRAALAVTAFFMALPTIVLAGEEILMRTDMAFDACPAAIENMLSGLNADGNNVFLVTHTGAHYKIKLVSNEANLVFLCNSVTEQITISRTTPGELVTAAN